MSAELLREAAAKMRERAEAATPGPWYALPADNTFNPSVGTVAVEGAEQLRADDWVAENKPQGDNDAAHIASWHPAVALAVADWLDFAAETARQWEQINHTDPETQWSRPTYLALQIARTYLGADS